MLWARNKIFHAGCIACVLFTIAGIIAAVVMAIVLSIWTQAPLSNSAAYNTLSPDQTYYGMTLRIVDNQFIWSNDLYDSSSVLFQQYSNTICNNLQNAMWTSPSIGGSYSGCAVGSFSKGSVRVKLRISFQKTDTTLNIQVTINEISKSIYRAISRNLFQFSLSMSQVQLYVFSQQNDPCAQSTTCQQVCTVTGTNTTACSCYDGYIKLSTNSCQPIDYCKDLKPCGNITKCILTFGSYDCQCNPGYTRNLQRLTCDDIDECDKSNPRHNCTNLGQNCHNTAGSFVCNCTSGYNRLGNGLCEDIDECTKKQYNCSLPGQVCKNTVGSYGCDCKSGWSKSADGSCIDIDECSTRTDNCTKLGQICVNTAGSFVCNCTSGYTQNKDSTCTDVNECTTQPPKHNCTLPAQYCWNTNGSFTCRCLAGYNQVANGSCVDIDECATGVHNCSYIGQYCSNVVGSFKCLCQVGYNQTADGKCNDFDECAQKSSNNCNQPGQFCVNSMGNYSCSCRAGWSTNGSCVDIDECSTGIHNCTTLGQYCTNTLGSFVCNCTSGYTQNPDRTCKDVNECTSQPPKHNCTLPAQYCWNTNGSFTCGCLAGYNQVANGSCVDINECVPLNPCSGDNLCKNSIGNYSCFLPANCRDYYRYYTAGIPKNGVQNIYLNSSITSKLQVYCEYADGDGWMRIQRRQDGTENFNRTYAEYINGFGTASGEHWLGLRNIQTITTSKPHALEVEIWLTDGTYGFSDYQVFALVGTTYKLSLLGPSTGNSSDALTSSNQTAFATFDSPNTNANATDCAKKYSSGWWYIKCSTANLNTIYATNGICNDPTRCVFWNTYGSDPTSGTPQIKVATMKIRPNP